MIPFRSRDLFLTFYDPFGKERGSTADYISLDYTHALNDLPTLTFSVPIDSTKKFGDYVSDLMELPFEVALNYPDNTHKEPNNARFLCVSMETDLVDSIQVHRFTCLGIGVGLRWATVWTPSKDEKNLKAGKREFKSALPIDIIQTLFASANTRQGADGLRWCNGKITQSYDIGLRDYRVPRINAQFNVSDTLEKVLTNFANRGSIAMNWEGRNLYLAPPKPVPPPEANLPFIDLFDAAARPAKVSLENIITAGKFRGNEGYTRDVTFSGAFDQFGRIEKFTEQNVDADTVIADGFLDALKIKGQSPQYQYRREYAWDMNVPHLWADYAPGDWVNVAISHHETETLQVVEVGFRISQDGKATGWDTYGTRIAGLIERMATATSGAISGAIESTTGAPTNTRLDERTPTAPTSLTLTDTRVILNEETREHETIASVSFTHSGEATDGTPISIDHYNIYTRTSTGAVRMATSTRNTSAVIGIPFGFAADIYATATATNGHTSAPSQTIKIGALLPTDVPPQPYPLEVSQNLGVIKISWRPRDKNKNPLPAIVGGVEVAYKYDSDPMFTSLTTDTINWGDPYQVYTWYLPAEKGHEIVSARLRLTSRYAVKGPWSAATAMFLQTLVDEAEIKRLAGETISPALDVFRTEQDAAFTQLLSSHDADLVKQIEQSATSMATSTDAKIKAAGEELQRLFTGKLSDQNASTLATLDQKILDNNIKILNQADNKITVAANQLEGRLAAARIDVARLVASDAVIDNAVVRKFAASKAFADTFWANTIISETQLGECIQDLEFTPKYWKLHPGKTAARKNYLEINGYDRSSHTNPLAETLKGGLKIRRNFDHGLTFKATIKTILKTNSSDYAPAVHTSGYLHVELYAHSDTTADLPIKQNRFRFNTNKVNHYGVQGGTLTTECYTDMHVDVPFINNNQFASNDVRLRIWTEWVVTTGPTTTIPSSREFIIEIENPSIREAYSGTVIRGGSITTYQIAANAITTEKLAAGAVKAETIEAGAIDATKLKADAIDGKTITGALIQTSKQTNVGLKLSTSGINVYNAGKPAFTLNPTTGEAKWSSPQGSNVSIVPSGYRARARVMFATGVKYYQHQPNISAITETESGQDGAYRVGSLVLSGSETTTNETGRADLQIGPHKFFKLGTLWGENNTDTWIKGTGAGELILGAGTKIRLVSNDRYNNIQMPNLVATTSGLNLALSPDSDEWQVYYISSSEKYKLNIEDMRVAPEKLLDISPRTWYDLTQTEDYANYLEDHAADRQAPPSGLWDGCAKDLRRIPGVVAEEVEAAGLGMFVHHGPDGELRGVMYDRLWTLLIPLMKQALDRISALEERNQNG